jgi:undecaprenyl pyrophosphate synthase
LPQYIAIIMDGNGRWVQKRHMSRTVGHAKGVAGVSALLEHCAKLRISNFLLWQIAYAELYFTDILWPDFDEIELTKAVDSYASRERRFGHATERVALSL